MYKRKTRLENGVRSAIEQASRTAPIFTRKKACTYILSRRPHKVVVKFSFLKSNGVYLDSSPCKTTEKFEHEIENRRHLSVTRESCPVRPLKPRPALGTRVKLQPHRERTVYISPNVCMFKNILSSPGGVVI